MLLESKNIAGFSFRVFSSKIRSRNVELLVDAVAKEAMLECLCTLEYVYLVNRISTT